MTARRQIPKYRLHKGTGQALVQIDGRRIYLGKYGTPESHEKYERILGEWLTATRKPVVSNLQGTPGFGPSVNELLLRYWEFAKTYYVKDGSPTKELASMREALRPVRQLYGNTDAREFGPLALKAVRQHMIDAGLSRGVINNRVNRIKRFFKWAESEELLPAAVHEALRTVPGLRYGRTDARETEPVSPAPQGCVDAVLPFLAPPVAAMVQLQRLTGMRSAEIVIMRPCDISRRLTAKGWINHFVVRSSARHPSEEERLESSIKAFGYYGGRYVLDAVLAAYRDEVRPVVIAPPVSPWPLSVELMADVRLAVATLMPVMVQRSALRWIRLWHEIQRKGYNAASAQDGKAFSYSVVIPAVDASAIGGLADELRVPDSEQEEPAVANEAMARAA